MATKQEMYENVISQIDQVCEKHKVKDAVQTALHDIIEQYVKPKAAGKRMDLSEVTKTDENGNITHIMCQLSGHFLPATVDFFYEDKKGKGINGLKRLSRQAESIKKLFTRTQNAAEKAIMQDVMDHEISPEEGKAKLEELKNRTPDYSTMATTIEELEARKNKESE